MFVVEHPPAAYSDPWAVTPFEARLMLLERGSAHIAYFYEKPDNSTFRYRVYNMIQALQASALDVGAACFHTDDIDRLDEVIDRADVLVVCRARYTDKLNRAILRARHQGKPVYFDVDDFVFDTDYVNLIVTTLDQDLKHPGIWDHWYAYIGRIGATLKLCDAAITTNAFLAGRIAEFAGLPTHVIPNFLNREQMEISTRIFEEKQRRGFQRTEQIYVGYFSGTPTHTRDFQVASSALMDLMEADPRIVLRVVGYMELKDEWRRFASRVEFYPLHDFINLQRLIGLVEINLVPLQDNVFTNCKSELKYFEAGIVGTLTVASPIHTYAQAIENGRNGYLARSLDWGPALETCIARLADYPAMAERAWQDAERRYAWYRQIPLIERTLLPRHV